MTPTASPSITDYAYRDRTLISTTDLESVECANNGLSVLAVRFGCYYSPLSSHHVLTRSTPISDLPRLATFLCV
jgi:hypothetical protein